MPLQVNPVLDCIEILQKCVEQPFYRKDNDETHTIELFSFGVHWRSLSFDFTATNADTCSVDHLVTGSGQLEIDKPIEGIHITNYIAGRPATQP